MQCAGKEGLEGVGGNVAIVTALLLQHEYSHTAPYCKTEIMMIFKLDDKTT